MAVGEKDTYLSATAELNTAPRNRKQKIIDCFRLGDGKNEDVAASFLAHVNPAVAGTEILRLEEKKLLRKIDWILIPLISVTCILAAVDKVIISNAAIYGMETDTHLTGNDYSWVGSVSSRSALARTPEQRLIRYRSSTLDTWRLR